MFIGSTTYFTKYKVDFVKDKLQSLGMDPTHVLDFGGGTGNASFRLMNAFERIEITPADIS
jgi:ubiquinone/menaquinone biosynthesis C-methylase UbiE